MLVTMQKKPVKSKIKRAPRIRVPNNERALFIVDTEKFVGVLQRLSLTGGSAILSKGPVPQGTVGRIGLNTVFGRVTAEIEFLRTGAEGIPLAQAFRFLAMSEVSSRRFAAAAKKMREAGFGEAEESENSLGDMTSQTLSKLRNSILRLTDVVNSGRRTKAEN
jgi:hypothetical protein